MLCRSRLEVLVALCAAVILTVACGRRLETKLVEPQDAASLDKKSTFLKAHMKNGDVYILKVWHVNPQAGLVSGAGEHFDVNRKLIGTGQAVIPLAEVALFETNVTKVSGAGVANTVVWVVSAVVTVACLVNPKACFGSCPTFYMTDGERSVLQAEGFSASIAPSLEARDVDALYRARPRGRRVSLRMTNEALETHVVRRIELLVAPRPAGGRVVATPDSRFWAVTDLRPPRQCTAGEGSCLGAVTAIDNRERSSKTSPTNLAHREFIELEFDDPHSQGPLGLVIEARQTFLSTFLFYQGLAYLGRKAVAHLAALERGDAALLDRARGFHHLLGGIDVQVLGAGGDWETVGSFDETGPLATDVQMVPLPADTDARRLRLRLTQGHWRLGYLALARLQKPVEPTVLRPKKATTVSGAAADPRALVIGDERTLVTLPGDEYRFEFELPEVADNLELFLASRGYYLEWMREEWLQDESEIRAAMLFYKPEWALRFLAPKFKKMEPAMEQLFWKSRYARPNR